MARNALAVDSPGRIGSVSAVRPFQTDRPRRENSSEDDAVKLHLAVGRSAQLAKSGNDSPTNEAQRAQNAPSAGGVEMAAEKGALLNISV